MIKGKIIIDFESDEEGECSWKIQQEGKDKLNDEDMISLFEHIIRETMPINF